MTVTTVANVYGSGSVALPIIQINADQLRGWVIRMETTVNDLVTMVNRHEGTINLQQKTLDAVLSQAKGFMEYVEKAHPSVVIEYHLACTAVERLTK